MKNLIKIFTLAIITSLVFWSCKKTSDISEVSVNDFVGGAIIERQPTPPTAAEMRKTTRTSVVVQSTGDNAVSTDITAPTVSMLNVLSTMMVTFINYQTKLLLHIHLLGMYQIFNIIRIQVLYLELGIMRVIKQQ